MIKGVNRQVVELSQPECEYFEKILFFVKPEYTEVSEGKLRERATMMSKDKGAPPPTKIRRNKFRAAARLIAAAGAGALTTALILLLR